MRIAVIFLAFGSSFLPAQSVSGGSIQGTVTDDQNKPVAGALVTVNRTLAASAKVAQTPFSRTIKTASDGSFLVQGLAPGTYSSCAQVPGDGYVSGCHWAPPLEITVSNGQTVRTGLRISKGSILKVRVLDPANVASQKSKRPAILMGVWDGHGHFIPVHNTATDKAGMDYQLTIPYNRPLNFQIVSSKLKLSDAAGVSLAPSISAQNANGNANQTAFQHNSGDPNPKSFQFTITGVNP